MLKKTLFFSLTIIIFSFAWMVSEEKKATTNISKAHFYPDLIEQLNLISKIQIKAEGKNLTIIKENKNWVISDNDNFLVQPSLIKRVLLQVAKLSKIEKKATSETGHRILGVNGLNEDGMPRRQITFFANNDLILTDLIVGKKLEGNSNERYFVRERENKQSWIAEGTLDFSVSLVNWVDSRIVDVEPESIKSVLVETYGERSIFVSKSRKSQTLFKLQGIPEGGKPKNATIISSYGSLLTDLRFDDVLSKQRVENIEPVRRTTLELFENNKIILSDYLLEGATFTSIEFKKGGKNRKEENPTPIMATGDNNRKIEEWVYLLPKYKRRIIERNFDTLVTAGK